MSEISGFVEVGQAIFDSISIFLEFIGTLLANVPGYFMAMCDFFLTYVIELPLILVSMFGELPAFAQYGLSIVLYCIYVAFIFRIIKLIIPFL